MSDIKDEPAFPMQYEGTTRHDAYGMTLRDYFAAKAMQSAIHHRGFPTVDHNRDLDAKDAYAMADAMIRARGQS